MQVNRITILHILIVPSVFPTKYKRTTPASMSGARFEARYQRLLKRRSLATHAEDEQRKKQAAEKEAERQKATRSREEREKAALEKSNGQHLEESEVERRAEDNMQRNKKQDVLPRSQHEQC